MYDIQQIRRDFPILSRSVYNRPLVYLDNAATTQKPRQVVDAMTEEYYNANANVHRGVHYLSQRATDLHEAAREAVRDFINAGKTEEIVFTRGTTESINLVASSLAKLLKADEAAAQQPFEVIVSTMEHHSNIVPWQMNGFRVRPIPMTDDGQLLPDQYEQLFNERTRLVSVAHVSNVLGVVNPVEELIRTAHSHGVPVLVDGAQSAPHFAIDVQRLGCDFFAFSGHKMYGPTGIGVLYGREEWLDRLPPYQGGGEMIEKVSFERTTFNQLPYKFEAGTPDYVATHGLATAIHYLQSVGLSAVNRHEQELTDYCRQRLMQIEGMEIYANDSPTHDAVVSFNIRGIHHLDIGTLLDRLGIAVRTGHHCAQPLMDRLHILGTVRASFALYNTREEVDRLAESLQRVAGMF